MKATPTHGHRVAKHPPVTVRTTPHEQPRPPINTPILMTPQPVHPAVSEHAKSRQVSKLTTYRTVQDAVSVTRIALETYVPSESRLADQPPPRLSIGSSGPAVRRPLDPSSIASVTRITVGAVPNVRVSTRQSAIISAPYDLRMGQTSEGHRISRARAIPSRHHLIFGNRDKRPAST